MNSKPTHFLALNQSRITDFMMCPRFYEMRHINRLDRGAKALRIGSMTHKLLEARALAVENGEVYEPKQSDVEREDMTIYDSEWEVAEKLYWAYHREYDGEDLTIIQPEMKVYKRFGTIETPIAHWEIWIIGTLDGIVGKDEHKYLKEYKTCANLGAAQFDKFLNDFQITTYLWLAAQGLGLTLDGALITLLPKTKDPHPARITVARTGHQFQEWEKTVLHESRNLVHCMEQNYFPQRQTNCTKWNRACIFHEFCLTNSETNLVDMEVRGKDYTDDLKSKLQKGEVNGN